MIALTGDQVESQGLKVEKEDITHKLIEPIDTKTGNRTAAVQMLPDPGFKHNAGETYWGSFADILSGKLKSWHPAISRQVAAELAPELDQVVEINPDTLDVGEKDK